MPIVETVVYAGVLPGLITLAAAIAARHLVPEKHAVPAVIAAATVAFILGYSLLMGLPPLPAVEATQWIFWLVVLAGIFSISLAYTTDVPIVRFSVFAVISLLCAILILNPFNEYLWEGQHVWLWVGLTALASLLMYFVLDQHQANSSTSSFLFLLAGIVFFTVPAFANAGSIKLFQIVILLTAIVGAV